MSRLFWKHFFAALLAVVALAEWVCASWLAYAMLGLRIPPTLHVLGPLFIYWLNSRILARQSSSSPLALRLRRYYTRVAFTSIFGFCFLLLAGLVAGSTWLLIQAVWADALPMDEIARLGKGFTTAGLLAVVAAIAYGYGAGQRRLWINRLEIPVAGLDPGLGGLRIVQISDLHLGPFLAGKLLESYVEQVNALDADVLVITGDVTDGLAHCNQTFPILARLRARHGVYVILGNHDVYTGVDGVVEALGRYTKFRVLRDEWVELQRGGARLLLVGLMDRGRDWARGLKETPVLDTIWRSLPRQLPVVVLSHRPDLFKQAARLGAALVLAGHTHGGQLALPWLPGRVLSLARFMTRYPRGTYRSQGSYMHVNMGLGVTGQPVRLATPREITVLSLKCIDTTAAQPVRAAA